MSSTRCVPMRLKSFASPRGTSVTVVSTRLEASRTVPRALIHDRLSWLERKKPRSGYATCESSTSAAHPSQSRNSCGRRSSRSSRAYDSSRATADGGAPAADWSVTTRTSRRWYEAYSENRNVTTSATVPRPLIAAIAMTMRAGPPTATMSPKPSVSTDVAAKYTVVPRFVGTGWISSRSAYRIRP